MKFIFSILLICNGLICFSQTDTIKIKASGSYFTTDALKNIYTIDSEKITKFPVDKNYKETSYFSHDYFGKISSVDVSDPFKILIYYQEYNQIIFLDKNLSEIGNIDLSEIEIEFSGTACLSKNKGVWVFDSEASRIIHLNKHLKISLQTAPLSSFTETDIETIQISEGNIGLVALIKDFGLLFFDEFGSYLRSLSIEKAEHFQLTDNKILIKTDKDLFIYNNKNFELNKLKTETENYKNIRIELDEIFLSKEDEIIITNLTTKF